MIAARSDNSDLFATIALCPHAYAASGVPGRGKACAKGGAWSGRGPAKTGNWWRILLVPLGDARQNGSTGRTGIQGMARKRSDLRIVIVDDNADATYTLAMLLERGGFTVVAQVHDAEQAVKCIKAERPHVAILDIAMPLIDGYEIARQLREEMERPLKLIAVSGLGQACDKTDALEAGFDAHLTKPANWPKLEALLISFLEESEPAAA